MDTTSSNDIYLDQDDTALGVDTHPMIPMMYTRAVKAWPSYPNSRQS